MAGMKRFSNNDPNSLLSTVELSISPPDIDYTSRKSSVIDGVVSHVNFKLSVDYVVIFINSNIKFETIVQ